MPRKVVRHHVMPASKDGSDTDESKQLPLPVLQLHEGKLPHHDRIESKTGKAGNLQIIPIFTGSTTLPDAVLTQLCNPLSAL